VADTIPFYSISKFTCVCATKSKLFPGHVIVQLRVRVALNPSGTKKSRIPRIYCPFWGYGKSDLQPRDMWFYMIEGDDEVQEKCAGNTPLYLQTTKEEYDGLQASSSPQAWSRQIKHLRGLQSSSLGLLSPRRSNVGNDPLHLGCDLSESGAGSALTGTNRGSGRMFDGVRLSI
jgi:hypothetical protein